MSVKSTGSKAVAIASSTGGPKALQSLIPFLPAELDAPVFIVQHMPAGFTEALSIRLDQLSGLSVKEAAEGDTAEKGHAYLARGGRHMEIRKKAGKETLHYMDEPPREGVRPCANYMYESLMDSNYDEIICVVLTGMGADGTEGIRHLKEKKYSLRRLCKITNSRHETHIFPFFCNPVKYLRFLIHVDRLCYYHGIVLQL